MIDEMTVAEAAEIFRYWEAHPPVHLLVAGLLGVKPKRSPGGAAVGLPPGFTVVGGEGLGMPAPVFDLGEMRARNRARAAAVAKHGGAALAR